MIAYTPSIAVNIIKTHTTVVMAFVPDTYGSVNAIAVVDEVFSPTKDAYIARGPRVVDFFPDGGPESRAMNMFLAYVVSMSSGHAEALALYNKNAPLVLARLNDVNATDRLRQVTLWNTAIGEFNFKVAGAFGYVNAPVFPLINVDTLGVVGQFSKADIDSMQGIFGGMVDLRDHVYGDVVDDMRDVAAAIVKVGYAPPAPVSVAFNTNVLPHIENPPDIKLDHGRLKDSLDEQKGAFDEALAQLTEEFETWATDYEQWIRYAQQQAAVDEIRGELQ